MAIRVQCTCGAEFTVREEYAGKKGSCPTCGATITIPGEYVQEEFEELETLDFEESKPASKPKRNRKSSSRKSRFRLSEFNQGSGRILMMTGLVMVLLSRGCDSTSNRSLARSAAQYEKVQNEFTDEWEEKKMDFLKSQFKANIEIEEKQEEKSKLQEERFSDEKRENFDYAAALETIDKEIDEKKDTISKANKEIASLSKEQMREKKRLELYDWRDYKIAARDSRLNSQIHRWWLSWLFLLGTIALTLGLLTVSRTGDKMERMVSLILISVIVISIYWGGMAWIDTTVKDVSEIGNQLDL